MEKIVPELLHELKANYESKNSLSTNERRFLCSAIVDYFLSRNIQFRYETMDDLAQQIVQHFPTEDKVFSKNKEILKEHTFFKDLFLNSHRNPGIIAKLSSHTVDFISVLETYVAIGPN